MDLTEFDAAAKAISEDEFEIEIKHPQSGKGTGWFVTLVSNESDRVKKVQRATANRALKKERRGGQKAQDIENATYALLAAMIVSWRGAEMDGEPFECTPENIRNTLEKYSWFAEQIDEAADDKSRFFTK